MKKTFLFISILLIIVYTNVQAQNYTIGLVASQFHNSTNDDRISEANDPFGYGLVFASRITEELSMGVTLEFLQDDLENAAGKEKDFRFHYSIFLHPFKTEYVHPYISSGIVYTHRTFDYDNALNRSDDNKSLINGRFSIGVDVPIISNLFVNGDLGIYTDGFEYVGWGSNVCFRVGL